MYSGDEAPPSLVHVQIGSAGSSIVFVLNSKDKQSQQVKVGLAAVRKRTSQSPTRGATCYTDVTGNIFDHNSCLKQLRNHS